MTFARSSTNFRTTELRSIDLHVAPKPPRSAAIVVVHKPLYFESALPLLLRLGGSEIWPR
jgi:hypothetical protein